MLSLVAVALGIAATALAGRLTVKARQFVSCEKCGAVVRRSQARHVRLHYRFPTNPEGNFGSDHFYCDRHGGEWLAVADRPDPGMIGEAWGAKRDNRVHVDVSRRWEFVPAKDGERA